MCATGDVHFLDPEDEIYRHILLASKGFEDADEPLPIYFKTTTEMLEEFSYLGKETAYEVVVTNTNSSPTGATHRAPAQGTVCPQAENSDEELKRWSGARPTSSTGRSRPRSWWTASTPSWADIIRCKYDVIYMSAQKLVQNSLEHGYLVGSRGSVGSSLVAFMSGITEVNSCPPTTAAPSASTRTLTTPRTGPPYGCGADMPDACPVPCGALCEGRLQHPL